MAKFGNIQAYDFKKNLANYLEDKYNYYCEFPKDLQKIPVKIYSSWVAKYEKDQSKLVAETVFTYEELDGIDVHDPKVIRRIVNNLLKGAS